MQTVNRLAPSVHSNLFQGLDLDDRRPRSSFATALLTADVDTNPGRSYPSAGFADDLARSDAEDTEAHEASIAAYEQELADDDCFSRQWELQRVACELVDRHGANAARAVLIDLGLMAA